MHTIIILQGRVVLPLPSVSSLAETAFTSPDRHSVIVHVLETAVVTWMKQVKMALYCDPGGAISRKGGRYAGPLEEIKVSSLVDEEKQSLSRVEMQRGNVKKKSLRGGSNS